MYKRKFSGWKRRNGTILAASVLWGCAAISSAAIVLATAGSIFDNQNWQVVLLRRENTAMQAQVIITEWFTAQVRAGSLPDPAEFELSAEPKDMPLIEFPAAILTELKVLNDREDIKVSIADQNYSVNFQAEAAKRGIPYAGPSEICVSSGDVSYGVYRVKRYQIYTEVSLKERPERQFVLSKNFLVLKDPEGSCRIITLFTKKQ